MHREVEPAALLSLWERALAQAPLQRGDALLDAATGEVEAGRTLAARNAGLAALHARWFGDEIDLISRCPACAALAQFQADCGALAAGAPRGSGAASHRLAVAGHVVEFRLPRADDVAAAAESRSAGDGDDDAFARDLLTRCVLSCTRADAPVAADALPLAVLDALSTELEALEPEASVSFAVSCPECGAAWDARLDLGVALWQKVQGAAERLLLDIDMLARHYGWSEPDVLALTPTRRAAYVQLAAS